MSDLPVPLNRNQRLDPEPDRQALPDDESGVVVSLADYSAVGEPKVDPETGDIAIETDDGGVLVQIDPPAQSVEFDDDRFYANLADRLDDGARGRIVDEVLQGIEADEQSRQEWLDSRAEGIKMLGTVLERASGDVGGSTGPFEGMSTVRHPLLIEAVVRFQANAAAELYPPNGPVKVRDDRPAKPEGVVEQPVGLGHNGVPPLAADDEVVPWVPPPGGAEGLAGPPIAPRPSREDRAEALEKGFNHNLTVVDRGYRPDSVRMLFWVGFGGCAFKKVYDCPIKERPVSRFVDAEDIIVNNSVSDHRDAERVTHRIKMRRAMVKRMQIAGVYRDVELHQPQYQPDQVEQAKASAQGLSAFPTRSEDQPRTLYESYVELDVIGYEHKRNGRVTGIPLPYKVTIDKDSRQLLELRRNWDEDDDTYTARQIFVKYGFIPAMGFYDLGLLHLLGNGDKALTAAWREAIDAGMFGNFPGFIYNEGAIRNWSNQNRVPPGGGIGVKTVGNVALDTVIKPLPYKEVGAGMVAMIDHIEQRMDRVAGTAEMPVGEGRQDAPVGTTLALIEQSTKVLAAVHIGLHASQAEEFELLKERYAANPESFWRWKKNKKLPVWEREEFLEALEDCEVVPAADPNTPSHMIRLIRCQAVKMVASQRPDLYDTKKVDRWIFEMIGISDPDQFFSTTPPQQGPDPMVQATMATLAQKSQQSQQEGQIRMAELQQKGAEAAGEHQARMAEVEIDAQAKRDDALQKAQEVAQESADRAADRQSEEKRQALKLGVEEVKAQQHGLGLSAAPPYI